MLSGMRACLVGADPEVELSAYVPKAAAKMQSKAAAAAAKGAAAGVEFLASAAKEAGAVQTSSGLVVFTITEGSGASPTAANTVQVPPDRHAHSQGRTVYGQGQHTHSPDHDAQRPRPRLAGPHSGYTRIPTRPRPGPTRRGREPHAARAVAADATDAAAPALAAFPAAADGRVGRQPADDEGLPSSVGRSGSSRPETLTGGLKHTPVVYFKHTPLAEFDQLRWPRCTTRAD